MSVARYEVQFLDGLGAWRRWAVCKTWDAAHASRCRLRAHLGAAGRIRIREGVSNA